MPETGKSYFPDDGVAGSLLIKCFLKSSGFARVLLEKSHSSFTKCISFFRSFIVQSWNHVFAVHYDTENAEGKTQKKRCKQTEQKFPFFPKEGSKNLCYQLGTRSQLDKLAQICGSWTVHQSTFLHCFFVVGDFVGTLLEIPGNCRNELAAPNCS